MIDNGTATRDMMPPRIVAPAGHAAPLARRLANALHGEAVSCDGNLREFLVETYLSGRPLIALCAAGIVIRTLAPYLRDKREDPPVVAVAADGSMAVPLLGGHAGANRLARRIAHITGGRAAITTAGDTRLGIALDDPPPGWRLARHAMPHVKDFTRALLAGATVKIVGEAPWLETAPLPIASEGDLEIVVDERRIAPGPRRLVYHPARLILGVGLARNTPAETLWTLVRDTLQAARLAAEAVAAVATLDIKADEPALEELCARLAVPLRLFAADELAAISVPNPSERVRAEVGTPSVAEAAALAAAGHAADLLVTKRKNTRATCAIARAPAPITDPHALAGRSRGTLHVVGLGPGAADWRTQQATQALLAADDWVGYDLYLKLAADLGAGKRLHAFALGEEEARVRHALALAGEGRHVALLCSGDPGIYAMAALVCEVLEDASLPDAQRRVRLNIVPGVSALQLAAARAGAPLGHDFCTISLSDLLTPWEVIERRIVAAAQGDFAIAFYNPRSRRRTWQLDSALAILRRYRPPHTPVVIASNLGREGERVRALTLAEVEAETVDMLSIVLVGNGESRSYRLPGGRRIVYALRGYGAWPGTDDAERGRTPEEEKDS